MSDVKDADQLAEELVIVLNRCDDEQTRLVAAMMVVADGIGSIACQDCRKLAKEAVLSTLPKFIDQAMRAPIIEGKPHHLH